MKSEFGKGLIYCLVLFAKHFENDSAKQISEHYFIMKKSEEERKKILCENPEPSHNYGFNKKLIFWIDKIVPIHKSEEGALSHDITMWANGASDHLYEIQIPDTLNDDLKGKIKSLQDRALEMGHEFLDKSYGIREFTKLKEDTLEISMSLDKELGVPVIEAVYK